MRGFGVHTSMWTMRWDRAGAERTIPAAAAYGMDFIEIALLDPAIVDAPHTRDLLDRYDLRAVCSLGLPEPVWASVNPEGAIDHLKLVLDTAAAMGAEAVSGVTYGGIGQRSGRPPTAPEYDNIARVLDAAARYAKGLGLAFGIEPVNRYENHLVNTAAQAKWMIEKVGADNIFIHLDTYHMNIEEKGAGNGILDAREHLRYIHLSESDRGTPGEGTCDWDEVFATLAAIGFTGGLAMESFINMPPEIAYGLAVWRPVADSFEEVMDRGLPFLRNKARQYRLV
ncbi:sugar phosphate isomerase/epimerase family protein [Rubellimicrobium roseum]|uniref:Sugar phosphate isomerase/epimerase n=1 Tax=Rubellimicrobium roseum TaxID=687525 RepID=A0A5C4NB68_9RHOB|nr:sugar phosphate isomerase/epimerase [Rubellimicrobium roseum]TNC66822.1 sugar phosphate isomerase/epimerase [Rubellimicrobium roseum]